MSPAPHRRCLIYRHRLGEGSHHYQCRRFGQRRKRRDHDFQLRVHRRVGATIFDNTVVNAGAVAGTTTFNDTSSAGSATINDSGAGVTSLEGVAAGEVTFNDSSVAGTAQITNGGASAAGGDSGQTDFFGSSSADHSTITNNPGAVSALRRGLRFFKRPPRSETQRSPTSPAERPAPDPERRSSMARPARGTGRLRPMMASSAARRSFSAIPTAARRGQ